MNLLLENFILDDSLLFSTEHIKDALDYSHVTSLVVLDLESLAMETRRAGEKAMADNCLSPMEQQQFGNFSYDKRKNEWLGGRISAKIAAAKCMAAIDIGDKKPIAWQNLTIESQASGRPFCVMGKQDRKPQSIPDLSISHSSDLAAAMAVNRGKCGIDIQQASRKTVKVRGRFCTREEYEMLQGFLPDASETVRLTLLWAAKEALRKAADITPAPGFLKLQLMEIFNASQGLWSLIFNNPSPASTNLRVAVGRVDDYLLAVTAGSNAVE